MVLLLILNLGLRVGEAIALEWDDFNLDKEVVYINKTLQSNIKEFDNGINIENGKTYSKIKQSAKTDSGIRILKLNESALYYISELKKYDLRHKIKSPYLCSTHNGTLNNPRNLQRSLDRIMKRTTITKAFCNTVRNAGHTPMVYASKSWLGTHLDVSQLSGYKIWVAHYAEKCGYSGTYHIWQNTDKGKVDGIPGYVDMNISSI